MEVIFPSISPDGTKVSFNTDKGELFVISMDGGVPRKIDERGIIASWSPDGNYLYYQTHDLSAARGGVIADVRTGNKTAVPSSENMFGQWLTQDILIASNIREKTKFQTFDLKTQKWSDFAPGNLGDTVVDWMPSLDGKYMYFSTAGAEAKAFRLRFADHQIETITGLKDLHRLRNNGETQINVAPDGSPIFTRDTGYQEIYALNIRWP